MKTTIKLLKNCPETIPTLVEIWYEVLGKPWIKNASKEEANTEYLSHLNEKTLPLSYVAFINNKPVGMCSLRLFDGIREDLSPWLGSLVIHPDFQKQGIGQALAQKISHKAKELEYKALYLFTLDSSLNNYYKKMAYKELASDKFRGHPVTVMQKQL